MYAPDHVHIPNAVIIGVLFDHHVSGLGRCEDQKAGEGRSIGSDLV